MMEKTIRMLKDKGIFDAVVKGVRKGMKKEAVEGFLMLMLHADEELQDQWIDDVHKLGLDTVWKTAQDAVKEQEALEALNDVDIDALYEKATGHRPDQEQEEDCDLDVLIGKVIMSVCKDVIKNYEEKEGC